jgi:hypothetical protein
MQIQLPNFIVIGAPKSGTTSLYYYLRQHPDVYLPNVKELHYFSFPELGQTSAGPGDALVRDGLCQSWEQYTSHYLRASNQAAIGDISPSYLYYSSSAQKIRETLGMVKIIAIIRNPVDKAYSQYMHMIREGLESLSFQEALAAETGRQEQGWGDIWRYAESSLYADRLNEFITVFGRENVKIVLFDDFSKRTPAVLADLLQFIGVDPAVRIPTNEKFNRTGTQKNPFITKMMQHRSWLKTLVKFVLPSDIRFKLRNWIVTANTGDKPVLSPELRATLLKYFHNDIIRVEQLIEKPTGWKAES